MLNLAGMHSEIDPSHKNYLYKLKDHASFSSSCFLTQRNLFLRSTATLQAALRFCSYGKRNSVTCLCFEKF